MVFQTIIKNDTFEGTITHIVAMKKKTTIISNVVTVCEDSNSTDYEKSESDKSDSEEPSIEDIQKAYQEMYDNWIKVCNVNKSLKDKIFELADENEELKGVVFNLKSIVKEKDEKAQEFTVELDSTKKNMRILNSGTTQLDQILNMDSP